MLWKLGAFRMTFINASATSAPSSAMVSLSLIARTVQNSRRYTYDGSYVGPVGVPFRGSGDSGGSFSDFTLMTMVDGSSGS